MVARMLYADPMNEQMLNIREVTADDAEACSALLCDSIRMLCRPDHGGDERLIAAWLANKTPDHVRQWLASPRVALFLAERGGEPVGVGCATTGGDVLLNYVAPGHRFSGVSRAMLAHLEAFMRGHGVTTARLESTRTARRFYREAGWAEDGEPEVTMGLEGYPMTKAL